MKPEIPEKLYTAAKKTPSPLYVVGGTCRNALAGLREERRDWDICAAISAEDFSRIAESVGFTVKSVYKNTGAVKLCADGEEYEYTCFRTDEYVRGAHRPVRIYFTDDINRDALRRDFKCNAIYYDVLSDEYVDPLGGIGDVKNKTINTVACASKVFGEDGLRLMRLARQAAQTGFKPSAECLDGARENRALIRDVSAERIWAELNAILHADKKFGVQYAQYNGLKLLKEEGVLSEILPELALGDKMPQRADFHRYDVLEHSLRCVMYADDGIRFAALLHDIGKPACFKKDGNFHRHECVGVEIARDICRRLCVSARLTAEVCALTEWHMYDYNCAAKENKIRAFLVRNAAYVPKLLQLKQADYSACKDDTGKAPCVEKWENILARMAEEGVPTVLKDLDVRGNELIAAGISPDKTGKTLEYLLSECAFDAKKNKKERLIKMALSYNGL